jgi:hypothetical protein
MSHCLVVLFLLDSAVIIHMFALRNYVRIRKNFSRDRRECPSSFIFYNFMRSFNEVDKMSA